MHAGLYFQMHTRQSQFVQGTTETRAKQIRQTCQLNRKYFSSSACLPSGLKKGRMQTEKNFVSERFLACKYLPEVGPGMRRLGSFQELLPRSLPMVQAAGVNLSIHCQFETIISTIGYCVVVEPRSCRDPAGVLGTYWRSSYFVTNHIPRNLHIAHNTCGITIDALITDLIGIGWWTYL